MSSVKNPVFFIIGATGSGKSKVAVHFAQELKRTQGYHNVVVINCDVYQCFNALPVCTNKPSVEELGDVSHAFLGFLGSDGGVSAPLADCSAEDAAARDEASCVLQNNEPFNVHTYERMVTSFISAYFQRHEKAAVIICGGTCYYVQALLFSNSLVYDGDTATQESGDEDSSDEGTGWAQLNAIDSDVASRYHPNDSRRIKRMLEIYRNTGQKPSMLFEQCETKLRFDSSSLFVVWTQVERAKLDAALDRRVDEMLQRGMLSEVRDFWTEFKGNPPHNSLAEAIGCKEFLHYFSAHGAPTISDAELEVALAQVKANTRRYARQQERWIKNRLVRLLHLTPLKEKWNHFLALRTDQNNGLLFDVQRALQVLLATSSEDSTCDFPFPLKEEATVQAPVCQETCNVCGLLVYGRGQMEVHLKSKRHRGALRRLALEKEQREVYGRELPPPKRKRSA